MGCKVLEASQKHGVDAIPAVSMVYLGAHFNGYFYPNLFVLLFIQLELG